MATQKYRQKSTEVTAVQLNTDTVGKIIQQIQKQSKAQINFEIVASGSKIISITFEEPNEQFAVITDSDYVVFSDNDYDVMSEAAFKQMFEPVPPTKFNPVLPSIPLIPPYQHPFPYRPRTILPDGSDATWEKVIVTD